MHRRVLRCPCWWHRTAPALLGAPGTTPAASSPCPVSAPSRTIAPDDPPCRRDVPALAAGSVAGPSIHSPRHRRAPGQQSRLPPPHPPRTEALPALHEGPGAAAGRFPHRPAAQHTDACGRTLATGLRDRPRAGRQDRLARGTGRCRLGGRTGGRSGHHGRHRAGRHIGGGVCRAAGAGRLPVDGGLCAHRQRGAEPRAQCALQPAAAAVTGLSPASAQW